MATRNSAKIEASMRKNAAENIKRYILPYIGGYEGIAMAEAITDYIAKKADEITVLDGIIQSKKLNGD